MIYKFFNFSATMILAVFLLSCIETISSSNDPSSSEPNLTFEGPAPDGIKINNNLILREVTRMRSSSLAGSQGRSSFETGSVMEIGGTKYLLAGGDIGFDIFSINDETANRNGNLLTSASSYILGTNGNLWRSGTAEADASLNQIDIIRDVATQEINGQRYIFLVQRGTIGAVFNFPTFPTFLRTFTIDSALNVTRVSADIASSIRNNHVSLTNTFSIHTKTISGTTYLFAIGGSITTAYSLSVFSMAAASGGGFSLTHVQDAGTFYQFTGDAPSIGGEITIGGAEYLKLVDAATVRGGSAKNEFFSIADNGRLTRVTGNSLGTVDASRLIGGGNASPFIITTDGSDYVFFTPDYFLVDDILIYGETYQPFEIIGNKLVEVRMPNNRVPLAFYDDIVTETVDGRHYIFDFGRSGVSALEFVTQFTPTAN